MSDVELETILQYDDEWGMQHPDAPQTEFLISSVGIDRELMQ